VTSRQKAAIVAGTLFAAIVLWSGWCLWQAERAGNRVHDALTATEASLQAHDVPGARHHLAEANAALDAMDHDVGRLGPIGTVARFTPIVRVQLRGIEAYVDAGRELTGAATHLTDALDGLLNPSDPNASLETTLDPLRNLDATLQQGVDALDRASERVNSLNGYRLLGPLDSTRKELVRRLTEGRQKAIDAHDGVTALLDFMGGNGPRRYLVLAQNPDEVRPTGGFIGSYGVLEADGAKVRLDRFEAIQNWTFAHPDVVAPPDQTATPFAYSDIGSQQRLSNVNASVDWPADAQLAAQMWVQGGEAPVDGVLLITPDMLKRILNVIGPVTVPEYNETVTEANLLERLDYYTHIASAGQTADQRKEFLGALAQPVLKAMLHAPTDKWVDLGEQLGAAGDAREMIGWSSQQNVEDVLVHHGWDGSLPVVGGDFFYNADFEYAAKNGRGLQRTFDHVVHVNPDGSGTVETTMTLANTLPPQTEFKLNDEANIYTVLYGPLDAVIDPASDEPDVSNELSVSGHPGAGYSIEALPLSSDSVKIVWRVPDLLTRDPDGTWRYSLAWRHVATNAGDVLHLSVQLPDGWSWKDDAPPSDVRLDQDFDGEWAIEDNS
jgi:Protein of unknown function (DUF4012)